MHHVVASNRYIIIIVALNKTILFQDEIEEADPFKEFKFYSFFVISHGCGKC